MLLKVLTVEKNKIKNKVYFIGQGNMFFFPNPTKKRFHVKLILKIIIILFNTNLLAVG